MSKVISEEWKAKKEFDVITIIEDSVENLMLQGMKREGALSLLAFQALIRMNDPAQAIDVMESVKKLITSDVDDDEDA
jgi:hypothetical protein